MRVVRIRCVGVAFAAVMVFAAVFVSTASGAVRRIKPIAIYSAADIFQTVVGVSPFDEGIILITRPPDAAGPSTPASNLTGLSRVRSAAGAFGAVQELSRSKDASVSGMRGDGSIPFTSTGTAIVGLNAAGAPSSYMVRKRGGLFSPSIQLDGVSNPACSVGNGTITGDDRLFLACPVITDGGSPTFTLGYLTSSNPLAALGALTTGFQAPVSYGQLDYAAASGGRGNPVRALGWSMKTGPDTVVVKAIVDTGVGVFGVPDNIAHLNDFPNYPYGRFNDVTVLGDGTVVESWEEVNASPPTVIKMKVRPPGAATSFGSAVTVTTGASGATVRPDGPDGRALIGWQHESSGAGDPASYWLLPIRPSSGGLSVATQLPGSEVQSPETGIVSSSFDVNQSRAAQITVCYDHSVKTWYRPNPGSAGFSSIQGPFTLATAPSGKAIHACSATIDSHGNVFATWAVSDPSGPDVVYSGGLELGTAPGLRVTQAPRKVIAGDSQTFTAVASDTSGIASVRWAFGDRSTAAGVSVRHRFRRPGNYRVSVTAKDRSGVATVRRFKVKAIAG